MFSLGAQFEHEALKLKFARSAVALGLVGLIGLTLGKPALSEDLNVGPTADTTNIDPTAPAPVLDWYNNTTSARSQVQEIQTALGVSEAEAQTILRERLRYYSSPEFQNGVRLLDMAYRCAETTAQGVVIATEIAEAVLAVPAAAPAGTIAVAGALAGEAALVYDLKGRMDVALGDARGDAELIRRGEALQEAGQNIRSALNTVTSAGESAKAGFEKLQAFIKAIRSDPARRDQLLSDLVRQHLKEQAEGQVEELTDAAKERVQEELKNLLSDAMAKALGLEGEGHAERLRQEIQHVLEAVLAESGEWGEPPAAPGKSVPASGVTGSAGTLVAPGVTVEALPQAGPVPGPAAGPPLGAGESAGAGDGPLTSDVMADFSPHGLSGAGLPAQAMHCDDPAVRAVLDGAAQPAPAPAAVGPASACADSANYNYGRCKAGGSSEETCSYEYQVNMSRCQ